MKNQKASREDRVKRLVEHGAVKVHRFLPSGREVWTVVGRDGDQLVDLDLHYCSCRHYYFAVLGGRDDTCYHIMAAETASKQGACDIVLFSDEELNHFIRLLIRDISSR